jgi:glucuronate isomerase
VEIDRVYDVHTHLTPERLGAGSLRNITGYHFLCSEIYSLGISPKIFNSQTPDREWMAVFTDSLPGIRNTTSFWMANTILQDLYGLDLADLKISTLPAFEEKIRERYRDPVWSWKILKEHCRTGRLLTSRIYSKSFKEPEGFDLFRRTYEQFDFGLNPSQDLRILMKRRFNKKSLTVRGIRQYIREEVENALDEKTAAFVCWLGRYPFSYVSDRELTRLLKGEKIDSVNPALGCFQFQEILKILDEKKSNIPVQIIIGAHTITFPDKNFTGQIFEISNSDILFSYHKLFGDFPDVKFDLLVSSSCRSRELDTMARLQQNVTVSGTWLHTMFANQVKKILSDRLEFLPAGKFSAFFSDAYNAEWVYGKLSLTKKCLETVLAEKVREGWLQEGMIKPLLNRIFWENPLSLYKE